jgi:hypothetical protein
LPLGQASATSVTITATKVNAVSNARVVRHHMTAGSERNERTTWHAEWKEAS